MAKRFWISLAAALGIVASVLTATSVALFEGYIHPDLVDGINAVEMGFLAFLVALGAVGAYLYGRED